MNNENFHPILKEPPVAHALHKWNEESRTLTYEYNGRNLITVEIPGEEYVGFRHGSDGNIQSNPMIQQIYMMLDHPVSARVSFRLSSEAVNMRPSRTGEHAVLGQVGRPLMYGVNGLYDIRQDLLIDWQGCEWHWSDSRLREDENGDLYGEMTVGLGPKPWIVNLRMHYYREHLGYTYHRPWEWRPDGKPVAGWCSWEACRRNVSLKDIREFSEFFASQKLRDYGLEYMQLDDGYENLPLPPDEAETLAEGWLDTNGRFPGGHEKVVSVIRENGFEPAIWTNANVTNETFVKRHEDCFIRDGKGDFLLGEWIDYLLDCSEETLEKHVYSYYKGLKELGYVYFKTDAVRHLLMDGLQEAVRQGVLTNEDARNRFRRFMEYARKGMGEDAYFLASWGVLSETVGVVDACRIAMDANPTWAGIRMQIVESARWFHTQRILFLNDPDHICTRTDVEWLKSVISLVSLSGSLLMLSDPLKDYDKERMAIIKKNLPVLTTVAGETGPLDMNYPAFTWTKLHGFAVNSQEKPVAAENVLLEDAYNMAGNYPTMDSDHPFASLWAFHMDVQSGSWCVVGRFAVVPLAESEIPIETLGLDPHREYHAFDFWEQKYLGRVKGSLPGKALALGSCQVIGLHPDLGIPELIASSRHVSMDAVSVESCRWDRDCLDVVFKGVKETEETYWFFVPECFELENLQLQGAEAEALTEQEPGGKLLKLSLTFLEEGCRLHMEFSRKG